MRRVVVTGLSVISPLAANLSKSWKRLVNGDIGIQNIQKRLGENNLACQVAGFVPEIQEDAEYGLNTEDFFPLKETRNLDKFSIFAKIAAKQAYEDANLENLSDEAKANLGVVIGSGIGGLPCIEDNIKNIFRDNKKCSPFFIPASIINIAPAHIAKDYGFQGPCYSVVSACASSGHAIEDAVRRIKAGDNDIMITGGSESSVCYSGIAGFAACRALATKFNDNPLEASRPWDAERNGFVMGEGAGILVLEELEHAKKRNAKIYAEIVGYGSSCDAHHITAPHPQGLGAKLSMQRCLQKAQLKTSDVDYINAHGTSTPLGDEVELNAIGEIFHDHPELCMSSNKSAIGHLLGAAAAVEAVFTIMSLYDGVLPPNMNLHNSISKFDNINLLANQAAEKKISYAMSNSFGFGGTNVSLLFKRFV